MRYLLVLCALLLGVPALAQDDPVEPPKLPEGVEKKIAAARAARHGKLSREKRDGAAVFVRLKEGGLLQVKKGEEWNDVSLDGLGIFLAGAKRAHHAAMEKQANSGYEIMPVGAQASKLFVSIEADPETPWRHLLWLMTIAAEQNYYKLELSDGKRRLLAFLPVDRGLAPPPAKPPNEVIVGFHVVARAEKPAKWGDTTVMRPTKVIYRFADRQSADFAWLPRLIRNAKKAAEGEANTIVVGEVKAGHKVPFEKVFDVLQAFLDHDVTNARFFGLEIPNAEVRRRPNLPFPRKNYDTPD